MAERVDHGNNRWVIVYGRYEGVERYAVNEVNKIIAQYVPYILTVHESSIPKEDLKEHNVLFIGTTKSNRYLRELAEKGELAVPDKAEGYSIKVMNSPYGPDRKVAMLCGADPSGALFAVRDFYHHYVEKQLYNHFNTVYNIPYALFVDTMPDYERSSAPAFPLRGAWTWGHTIRNYKRYIENMSRWKMNCLTLWNDFVPLNAKELVEYAHDRGIKVVWGYSWCWGEPVDPNSADDLEKWSQRIVSTYEEQYKALGIDGLYFQTFTEHSPNDIEGRSTAELAADWVNKISARFLEKYPEVWLHFGLHATSVSHDLAAIAKVDPRISIIWEDFPGFPYHHDPKKTDRLDETLDLVRQTSRLRGRDEKYGAVLKGLSMTNWLNFENQKGPYLIGESDEAFEKKEAERVSFIWKYANTYWQKNIGSVLASMRAVEGRDNPGTLMSVLLEDGMWESRCWWAGAVFAEAAWDPDAPAEDIMEIVNLSRESYR